MSVHDDFEFSEDVSSVSVVVASSDEANVKAMQQFGFTTHIKPTPSDITEILHNAALNQAHPLVHFQNTEIVYFH